MKFSAGTQLGAYEIVGLLGTGGMGEVYRARDSKLKREVAIKVLPDAFAADPERVARFQREAEVLASLNHPHIAAIYDLAVQAESRFLVLELVEGETLADRIARGRVPLDEALMIAKQIADALEAAHERGFVHRDLKPANVKVSGEDNVKVLDFGLAKVRDVEQAGAGLSQSPTLMTAETGVILGTAAYMSPEQARGRESDRTTDIWAFGCVLYEMLTGSALFEGESVGEILAGVFKGEPDWSRLPADTPEGIRRLLRRCLQKDRQRRLRSIGDARIEIDEALNQPAETGTSSSTGTSRRRLWQITALSAAAVVAAFLLGGMYFRSTPVASPEARFEWNLPTRFDSWVALSPDGRMLAFGGLAEGKWQLWLRPLDSVTARPLPGTEQGIYPFWSPDSRSLGFFADGWLKRIDIAGGPATTLARAPEPRGGSWGANGSIIFSPSLSGGLYRVSAKSGDSTEVTHVVSGQTTHRFPHFLPDGRHFFYFAMATEDTPAGIHVAALDGSASKRLLDADGMAVYSPAGLIFFRKESVLLAQRFDAKALDLRGDPFQVAEHVATAGNSGSVAFSVASNGTAVYLETSDNDVRRLAWFDRSGKEVGNAASLGSGRFNSPELSPDGSRIALFETVDGNIDIFLIETTRWVKRRLTLDPRADQWPIWSPGGDRIVFSTVRRKGRYEPFEAPSNGNGPEKPLLETSVAAMPSSWSSDGRYLLQTQFGPQTGFDVWFMDLSGEKKVMPLANRAWDEMDGRFSKDMRWIAYESNETGRFEIFVQPFSEAGERIQISREGGMSPRWRGDGKELFYIAPDGTLMSVNIAISPDGKKPQLGPAVTLAPPRIAVNAYAGARKGQYAITDDGQRFLMVVPASATPQTLTVILNWAPKIPGP